MNGSCQILKQEKWRATKKKEIYDRRMRCNKNGNKRGFYTDYKKRFFQLVVLRANKQEDNQGKFRVLKIPSVSKNKLSNE